jgi:transposase-like protein
VLDRGVEVGHATIFRWIQAYAVELEKRIRPHLRADEKSVWVFPPPLRFLREAARGNGTSEKITIDKSGPYRSLTTSLRAETPPWQLSGNWLRVSIGVGAGSL